MADRDRLNILLVDDQPAKLLTYEVILRELGENLISVSSGKEALEQILKNEIAVVLVDVCMPELDGFELASLIREHPRFRKIAMIFISAIHLAEIDHLRGYEMGAVDYVPVPVVPEVLRAKVRVFTDLYRKTRELERLNAELEERVGQRTAELQQSTGQLLESERRRSLALVAGKMGSWEWDLSTGQVVWDEGQHAIYGVVPGEFVVTPESMKVLIVPEDWEGLRQGMEGLIQRGQPHQAEFRVRRPSGEVRWCASTAAASWDKFGKVARISGVTIDITERKEAEERQILLAREVDHRAKNAMAIVQSIVRLTKAGNVSDYSAVIDGRIGALSRVHAMLSDSRWQGAELTKLIEEELAPYRSNSSDRIQVSGPRVLLDPTTAQTLALAIHELATNAAKYGSLSQAEGSVTLSWDVQVGEIVIRWQESGGPSINAPKRIGFGTRIITNSVEKQLGGAATFTWRPEGLLCTLHVPKGRIAEGANGRSAAGGISGCEPMKPFGGHRILIVEDEALVGMMLEDHIKALGLSVVAVCANIPQALQAIDDEAPDAAILDVNVGGQLVYPVADKLAGRGIPFVFMTGYGQESVDRRFSDAPIFEKPIERAELETIFAGRQGLKRSRGSRPGRRQ